MPPALREQRKGLNKHYTPIIGDQKGKINMGNGINELDTMDEGLKGIFGHRFEDMTTGKATAKPMPAAPAVKKETAVQAAWEPDVENKNNVLRGNVLRTLAFAGLNLLVWAWQLKGLMAASIATPSMWVCTAVAGYYIGRTVKEAAE